MEDENMGQSPSQAVNRGGEEQDSDGGPHDEVSVSSKQTPQLFQPLLRRILPADLLHLAAIHA